MLRIEVPAGSHSIRLLPESYGQVGRLAAEAEVTVFDGRNTYVIGWFPDGFTPPRILTSTEG